MPFALQHDLKVDVSGAGDLLDHPLVVIAALAFGLYALACSAGVGVRVGELILAGTRRPGRAAVLAGLLVPAAATAQFVTPAEAEAQRKALVHELGRPLTPEEIAQLDRHDRMFNQWTTWPLPAASAPDGSSKSPDWWWVPVVGCVGVILLIRRLRSKGIVLALLLALPAGAHADGDKPPGWVSNVTRMKLQLRRSLSPEELELCRAQDEKELAAHRAAGRPADRPSEPPGPTAAMPCPGWFALKYPHAKAAFDKCSPAVAERLVDREKKFFRLVDPDAFLALAAVKGDPVVEYVLDYGGRLTDKVAWAEFAADPDKFTGTRAAAPPPAAPPAGRPQSDLGRQLAELPAWAYVAAAAGLVVLCRPRKRAEEAPAW